MSTPARQTLLLLLVFPMAASAVPIDLKGAYKSALERTESLGVEKAKVAQAEERQSQASGALYPQLALNGRYLRQDTGPTAAAGGNAAFTRGDQYSVSVGVNQALFRGLAEFAEMRRRDILVRAQKAGENRRRQTLYRDVAKSFYAVLSAEHNLINLQSLYVQTNKRVSEVRQRVKIGRNRKGDLFSSESQAATLEAQIAAAVNVLEEARQSLKLDTLVPIDAELAGPTGQLPQGPGPLDSWLKSLKERPDLQALQLARDAADESVSVARGGHFPSVDASANYYLTRTGVLANSKWDLGLTLTVPIFSGGTVQATVREAVESRKQAELELALAERTAEAEVRTTHGRLSSLISQMKTLKKAAELSEQNYKIQSADYRLGLVTNLEVIQALNSFQETKRVYEQTYFETWASLAALESAVGKAPL